MKRFFLLIVLVMVVSWIDRVAPVAVQEARRAAAALGCRAPWCMTATQDAGSPPRRGGKPSVPSPRPATRSARPSMRSATRSAKLSTRRATKSTRRLMKCGWPLVSDDDRSHALPPVPPSPPSASEEAEGLPGADRAGDPGDRGRGEAPPTSRAQQSLRLAPPSSHQISAMHRDRAAVGHQGARRG